MAVCYSVVLDCMACNESFMRQVNEAEYNYLVRPSTSIVETKPLFDCQGCQTRCCVWLTSIDALSMNLAGHPMLTIELAKSEYGAPRDYERNAAFKTLLAGRLEKAERRCNAWAAGKAAEAEAEARLGMGRELPVAERGPSMSLLKRKRRSASPMARPPQLEFSDSAQQLPAAAGPASRSRPGAPATGAAPGRTGRRSQPAAARGARGSRGRP